MVSVRVLELQTAWGSFDQALLLLSETELCCTSWNWSTQMSEMFWSSFWLNSCICVSGQAEVEGIGVFNQQPEHDSAEFLRRHNTQLQKEDLWWSLKWCHFCSHGSLSIEMFEATGATAAAEERKKQEHQVHIIGKLCKRCFASITLARLLTYKKHWTTWATRHKELSHSNQESSSRLLFSWLKWKESAEETWSFQSVLARFNAKWLALDMFDMFAMFAMFAWYDHAMSCWRHLLTWCYLCIGVA